MPTTLLRVNVVARSGSSVTIGVPDEYGGQATLTLSPPHVDPMFLATPGSTAMLLMDGPVPHLLPGDLIMVGDPDGSHLELNPTGMYVYVLDAGTLREAIRLGTAGDDFFAITNTAGQSVAAISSTGAASFEDLSLTSWPTVAAGDWTGVGGALDLVLDRRPRGVSSEARLSLAGPATTTQTGWREFSVNLYPERTYRLSGQVRMKSTVAADVAQLQVRYTSAAAGTTPAQPVLASTLLLRTSSEVNATARQVTLDTVFSLADLALSVPSAFRFLICYSRTSGTGSVSADVSADEPGVVVIEDAGPAPRLVGTAVNDGSGGAVTSAPTLRTLTVDGAWSNTYNGDGTHRTAVTTLEQGKKFAVGDRKTLLGFRDLTELVGSTVHSVTLRVNAEVWNNAGGGNAVVGFHNKRVQPTGTLVGMTGITADVTRPAWTGLGVGFVTLTGFAPQEWATGAKRGIYFGVAQGVTDPDNAISGQFSGPANAGLSLRPQLTITYTI